MTTRSGTAPALIVALAAGAVLLWSSPHHDAAPPARATATTAWPRAQRADLPAHLADGPLYQPLMFLDARVSVGTAPSPDGTGLRLVLRGADGAVREMRRLPLDDDPAYDHVAVAGDELVWVETTGRAGFRLWTADLRGGTPARHLTADVGNAVFRGSQFDLVIGDGRVHWVAAAAGAGQTQIRSVALTGGPVDVRTEAGTWALTAWPWLVEATVDVTGATRLRNLLTHRDRAVANTGLQTMACTPVWCRATSAPAGDLTIDLVHPDGTGRRRIASGSVGPALADVAVLDRFEVLSQPDADTDVTGISRLVVYDIDNRRTVDVSADVSNAAAGNGVLFYATGVAGGTAWHSIDLRTV